MNSDRISKLILLFIPTNKCNLQCDYCFISHTNDWDRDYIEFKYSVSRMVGSLTRERLGGTCYINLTAQGETLLYRDVVELTTGLLKEGHYVELVTNGLITGRIKELLALPEDLQRRLFFKISYHYKQLKERNLGERFWGNVRLIKSSPCSFTLELMPHDEIAAEMDEACNWCIENAGATCHATVARTQKRRSMDILTSMSAREYISLWSKLDSEMFDLKIDLLGVKRKEFCYAGAWSLLVDIASGETSQCYGRPTTQNIFEDIDKPIRFAPVGHTCTLPYCVNGHAHIAWGLIPELAAPSYYEIRNRECLDGSNWVEGDCDALFHQKLVDNNKQYSKLEKAGSTIAAPFRMFCSLFHDPRGVKRKLGKLYRLLTGAYER